MGTNPNASNEKVHQVIDVLRNARAAQRITQEELAVRMGYGKNTLHNTEKGKVMPTLQFVDDYATALGYQLVLLPITKER